MTAKRTPRTAKGRATRDRIVRAAADLVAEKGSAGMSLDDVGERAGASRSQIYHYFEDRDDLVRAVVDASTDEIICNQGELLHQLNTWDGIDRWFEFLVQSEVSRDGCGGCPLGTLVGQLAERDHKARKSISEGLERWENYLCDGLLEMQKQGKLKAEADLQALATATMASIQGGILLTQVRRDPNQLRISLAAARNNLHLAKC